jgi:hypothetical protein
MGNFGMTARLAFAALTAAGFMGSRVEAQADTWTWIRDFRLAGQWADTEAATGFGTLVWADADSSGNVLFDELQRVQAPLINGRLDLPLPLLNTPKTAMLIVRPEDLGAQQYAPYVEIFELGPVFAPTTDSAVIIDTLEPITDLREMSSADTVTGDFVYADEVIASHPMFEHHSVSVGRVRAATAAAFRMPPRKQASPQQTSSPSSIGSETIIRPIGGVFFDLPAGIDGLDLAIPQTLSQVFEFAKPTLWQVVDYTTGTRLAYGRRTDELMALDFPVVADEFYVLLYEEQVVGEASYKMDVEPDCPFVRQGPGIDCDEPFQVCTGYSRMLGELPVTMCPAGADGNYLSPGEAGGSSVTVGVSSSNTTGTSHQIAAGFTVGFTQEAGTDLKVLNFKATASQSYSVEYTGQTTASSTDTFTESLTIVAGSVLAYSWKTIKCCFECHDEPWLEELTGSPAKHWSECGDEKPYSGSVGVDVCNLYGAGATVRSYPLPCP